MTAVQTHQGAAHAASKEPKPGKKARVGQQGQHVAPVRGRSAKKASPANNAPKGAQRAKSTRGGSKSAQVLELLQREGGAILAELMEATGWQAHSVRGFLSGTVGEKMGLVVVSAKEDGGKRRYSIKA